MRSGSHGRTLEGMRVFLSGPMSGCECNNVAEFMKAHVRLRELGVRDVYNPAAKWVDDVDSGRGEEGHDYYMRRCLRELTRIDASFDKDPMERPYYDLLVQLDGWRDSDGARLEHDVAVACGIGEIEMGILDETLKEER